MEKVKEIKEREKLVLGAVRATIIDIINKANSGHPGMALDAAPLMLALYRDHLIANPADPEWKNRDRLVFSSGHASALLYTYLHFCGYAISLDDLKNFRQLHSLTPGHPEFGVTPGVDAGGGPLGQGIAQAVGMAIAEASIAANYPDGDKLMDHYTYCLCGDGCLEEGISQEAISLAGHLKLNKLILFYDENQSTLDGPTSDSLSENVKLRFLASEWNVIEVDDGENVEALSNAISSAKESKLHPSVIIFHTKIGKGSKNEGLCKTHGSPLGEEDGAYAKNSYGYTYPPFEIPEEAYSYFKEKFLSRGLAAYDAYNKQVEDYKKEHEDDYKRFLDAFARNVEPYMPDLPAYAPDYAKASRVTSGEMLKALVPSIPFMMGGSADVAGSTNTNVPGILAFTSENRSGRDIRYGIREFAMAAVNNGMLLHGGILPYCACFFVFADYMKPAIRMAALQKLPSIYLFTHDSLAVGEDGPTHQPIEQLAMLRSLPNLIVCRPSDANEVKAAYITALESKETPVAIVLSRQGLPMVENSSTELAQKGAYMVYGEENDDYTLFATGSEVKLAIDAAKLLKEKGISIKVISMMSFELFEKQEESYREKILNNRPCHCISLECGSTFGWGRYARKNIGVDDFGASGKAKDVLAAYGFTPEEVAKTIEEYVNSK